MAEGARYSVGSASRELVRQEIARSSASLAAGEHQYFSRMLKARDTWRCFEAFRHSCVYLDIETDGTSVEEITCIGLYDGKEYACLLKGEDLESFRDRISHYSMIVTFFGTGFDLPVLQKRFRGVLLDHIHIDLCTTLRFLGVRGGLKAIERQLGIARSPETADLSGYDAVRLWRAHRSGNSKALDLLVRYNREDTVNLERLAVYAYARHRRDLLNAPPRQRVH